MIGIIIRKLNVLRVCTHVRVRSKMDASELKKHVIVFILLYRTFAICSLPNML